MPEIIETSALEKIYPAAAGDVQALAGISLGIEKGEFVAIMGPSGSGKSTLMSIFGLLDRPTAGTLLLEGEDVSRLSSDEGAAIRNRKVGFIFQSYNLLPRSTAIENVELPLIYATLGATQRRAKAIKALEFVGLGTRGDHWPNQLSGGEQQRVAVARAIVSDPAILLADEPTGSLDTRTGHVVLAILQALNAGKRTIIMVTHDPSVARHAKRVITLRDGRITEDVAVTERIDALQELQRFGDRQKDATGQKRRFEP